VFVRRDAIAEGDTIALSLDVKQAHWNLKGRGVHELLDEVVGRLRDASDMMAGDPRRHGGWNDRGGVEDIQSRTVSHGHRQCRITWSR
jgi:starvation-inducible DNA-binding protein